MDNFHLAIGLVFLRLLLGQLLLFFLFHFLFELALLEKLKGEVENFLFVRLLLLFQLLLVVVFQLGGELLALLVLFVHLPQVHFELLQQAVDRVFVLLLNLLDLFFESLLHLEAFLLQLQVAITLLLKFLFEEPFDLFDLFVVVLFNFLHCFQVLALLQFLLVFQVVVALLEVGNVVVFLLFRLLFLLLVASLVLGELGLYFALRGVELSLQLLLLFKPLLHLGFLDKDDVGHLGVHDRFVVGAIRLVVVDLVDFGGLLSGQGPHVLLLEDLAWFRVLLLFNLVNE